MEGGRSYSIVNLTATGKIRHFYGKMMTIWAKFKQFFFSNFGLWKKGKKIFVKEYPPVPVPHSQLGQPVHTEAGHVLHIGAGHQGLGLAEVS